MSRLPGVCILTETYYPVVGGGETQARALAEALVTNGFTVNVITRRTHKTLKKKEEFGTFTVYRIPPVGSEHYKKWGLLISSLPILFKLRRNYDLIFVSGFRVLGIPAVLVSKLLGKACILKADSLGEMSGAFFTAGLARFGSTTSSLFFRSFLWFRNKILIKADSFVAISSVVASELIAHGVNPKRINLIPNSVDTSRFSPVTPHEKHALRKKLDLSQEDILVNFTGRLVSYKGLPLLLSVWREIQSKHKHVRLLLVGSGGLDIHNCEAGLKAYVSQGGLKKRVRFTGSVQNVQEYLQASDIFVFPTQSEAFGISLIEAMACGLPVISTSVGGVIDILQDGQNGIVVHPGDFWQLYHALETLITDTSFSACLGQAARKIAQERYSDHRVSERYVNLFRQLYSQILKNSMPGSMLDGPQQ